jgi:3-hydroxyacyl-CoA dehydrogenase
VWREINDELLNAAPISDRLRGVERGKIRRRKRRLPWSLPFDQLADFAHCDRVEAATENMTLKRHCSRADVICKAPILLNTSSLSITEIISHTAA